MLDANDRWAINETLALHGHIADGGDLSRLDEIFTSDIVYDMSGVGMPAFEGIEEVGAAAARMPGPMTHYVTNIVITGDDGETATVRSKGLMIMGDGRLNSVVHCDDLRREGGRWLISRRVITPQQASSRDAEL